MQREPIFIVGLPACGKSTFGRALAHRLGREYIDLDTYIENRFHTTVKKLFSERGEKGFRLAEAAMLREVGEFENVVIATGGGTPCHADNMEYMNSRGMTVWLQASLPRILNRLERNRSRRPLLASLEADALRERVETLERERKPYYSLSAITFATDRLESVSQISASVEAFMEMISDLSLWEGEVRH